MDLHIKKWIDINTARSLQLKSHLHITWLFTSSACLSICLSVCPRAWSPGGSVSGVFRLLLVLFYSSVRVSRRDSIRGQGQGPPQHYCHCRARIWMIC